MNFLNQIVSEKVTHALGWTVLHALWQVSLLALIMAIVLWFLKNKSAKIRYTVGCATLFLMLGISQVTFLYQFLNYKQVEKTNPTADASQLNPVPDESFMLLITTESNWTTLVTNYLNEHIQMIVALWIFGFLMFAIRLFGGLHYISKIRKTAQFSIDDKWKNIVANLSTRFPIQKSVQLAASAFVQVPMIIGYFKPLILFPIGALNNLDQKEVEAILAHELGHIFRNDYLINILQSIVDVLFYFHPAAWWISSQIRMERENCCDDLAIEITNCPLTYAKALVSIKENALASPMMAMALMKDDKKLLNRIKRILNQPTQKTHAMEKLITSCLLLFLICGLTISANLPVEKKIYHENDALITTELPKIETKLDTIPIKKKIQIDTGKKEKTNIEIHSNSNGKEFQLSIKDGIVKKLVLDGKVIPENEYDDHIDLTNKYLKHVPKAPAPPVAPQQPNYEDDSKKVYFYEKTLEEGDNILVVVKPNGKVSQLEVNGKLVPKSEFHKYEGIVDDIINERVPVTSINEYGSENERYNSQRVTKGIYLVEETENGDKLHIAIDQNGEMTEIKVNGKEILPSELENYEDEIEELMNDLPKPPVPPTNTVPPAPPAPPTTPAPPTSGGGLSFESDVLLKRNHSEGTILIEVDPQNSQQPIDISVVDHEVFINGEKVDENYFGDIEQNKLEELMDLASRDDDSRNHAVLLAQLAEARVKGISPAEFQIEPFDFDAYVNQNKYPKSLKEIHNEFNQNIIKLKQEGTFPEGLEELAQTYSQQLENELQSLKVKAQSHFDNQNFSIHKFRNKAKLMSMQSNMNEQLFQSKLANELLNDGLIDSIRNFSFQLKKDRMKVNGKKYTGVFFEKYSKLYEDIKGSKVSGKLSYSFRNNGAL